MTRRERDLKQSAGIANVFSGAPTGWVGSFETPTGGTTFELVEAACQTPITVGGIGVPEFSSLYVAIALGAVAYFMLSRHFTRRPMISAEVEA